MALEDRFSEFWQNSKGTGDLSYLEDKNRQFAAGTVKYILGKFKLGSATDREMCKYSEDNYGDSVLTCEAFNAFFADFPLRILSAYVASWDSQSKKHIATHADPNCSIPSLLSNFTKSPVFKAFEQVMDSLDPSELDRPIGMVFPRKGYQRGLIMHTGLGHEFWRPKVFKGVFDYGTEDEQKQLIIEPFHNLIGWIATKRIWQPEA